MSWWSKPYPNDPKTLALALEWDNLTTIEPILLAVRALADQEHVTFQKIYNQYGVGMASSQRLINVDFERGGTPLSIELDVSFFNGSPNRVTVKALYGDGWKLKWGTKKYTGKLERMENDLAVLILSLV